MATPIQYAPLSTQQDETVVMLATLLTLCINLAQRLLDDETMRIQHNSRGKLLIQMRNLLNQMRVTCFSMNLRQDFFSITEWHSSSSSQTVSFQPSNSSLQPLQCYSGWCAIEHNAPLSWTSKCRASYSTAAPSGGDICYYSKYQAIVQAYWLIFKRHNTNAHTRTHITHTHIRTFTNPNHSTPLFGKHNECFIQNTHLLKKY